MGSDNFIQLLTERIGQLMATAPFSDPESMQRELRVLLGGALQSLGVVGREEFEMQARALEELRERVAALEAQLSELRQGLENCPP